MYVLSSGLLFALEHRQSRLSIILEGPRLQLKVTRCISNQQGSQPVLGALELDVDFSSLAMKGLDGCFFKCEAVLSAPKLLLSVATSMNYLSWISWTTWAAASVSAFAVSPGTFILWGQPLPSTS